ncbi:hypothetical protein CH333_06450 [candidate division WOR-3 bacterium JGI_Cruoil_03_44_89]|uniref:FlgD Ig-like domain-containing protein n=1 Tax=candidate division WOR-3 bacterium JGI_Cruoil_03_44_89 TaxID=1973748 RepID=A0A235BS52_UNCW3|nr:MAG: hypothetical protein CH333_06450 [candidate division WOR-3 bacterium JGI_Cruoil_03_44_89]
MKKFFVLVIFCLTGIISADPIPLMISEFQTSPDSLERIELNYYTLGELTVVTRAGTAYVDTSLLSECFPVIDSTNTEGNFSLDDVCDTITIFFSEDLYVDTLSLIYPVPCLPAPPPYASGSHFYQTYVGEDWYIDSTPTFGEVNDDYPYCRISGAVFGGDSVPIEGAEVKATLHEFWDWVDTSDVDGSYSFTDIYPGSYTLIATRDGYYPDTIGVSTHALCPAEEVDFYLSIMGIEEESNHEFSIVNLQLYVHPNPFSTTTVISYSIGSCGQLSVIGKSQGPITDHRLLITLSIYGLSGSLIKRFTIYESRFTNHEITWDGRNESGISVPPGIYFIRLQTPYGTSSTKVTRLR